MTRLFSILIMLLLVLPTAGQKQLKPIRAFLKAKNANEAIKAVQNAEKDSTLRLLPKLYEYGKQAQILINDEQNEKIYLRQAYDTVRFFSSTQSIYDYILKCRDAELYQLAHNGDKARYAKENSRLVHQYYNNLGAAGRFFFAKEKYEEAFSYLNTYLTIPTDDIWGTDKKVMQSTDYRENAYLYLLSAYRSKHYEAVEQYADLLMADTAHCLSVMEHRALSAIEQGDTTTYQALLQEGLIEYPQHMFFFNRLADLYALQGRYKTVVMMADSLLSRDSLNLFYLEAKCVSHLNLKQYEECIQAARRSLAIDTTLIDTHYYIGVAYCNLAADIVLPANINSKTYRNAQATQRSLYASARPYLETYRQRAPEKSAVWAPLLYRVYFHLNEGKLFDEMDRLIKKTAK